MEQRSSRPSPKSPATACSKRSATSTSRTRIPANSSSAQRTPASRRSTAGSASSASSSTTASTSSARAATGTDHHRTRPERSALWHARSDGQPVTIRSRSRRATVDRHRRQRRPGLRQPHLAVHRPEPDLRLGRADHATPARVGVDGWRRDAITPA